MLSFILKKFAGRHHRKYIDKCRPIVARINEFELQYQNLTEEQLRAKTDEFRARLKQGESLDQILPEAFAAVKNAARRLCGRPVIVCDHELKWDMVHFDVQLIGGITLHEGRIAEMATGEGKTLVATLPLYLNALTGKNAQLVTVNDYLARRDSEWMGYLYNFLGLTVGCIQQQMHSEQRREMYARDITYGTASEFGFDYLRDNGMATRKENQVQRDHFYCIVDEIDSILVDEARTPLIISGPAPIEREQPFTRLKPGVERLVADQLRLINRLVKEASDLLEKKDATAEDKQAAALKMLQVKLGMPKNKQLLRLQENPDWRKLLDKTDVEMHSDFNKDELYKYKEELFFSIDEKNHQADLTELGRKKLRPDDPDAFVLPDLATLFIEIEKDAGKTPEEKEQAKRDAQSRYEVVSEDIHALSQLLRAYSIYERDVEYVVQEGKVVIVDENTGRIMAGRRWSDGLHQAVEAKENVTIERETRTYATVTIQNYFRMYEKLAGMTGTAETEATEFNEIYRLAVTQIPTNKPCIRIDQNDSIFKTRRDKYNAVVKQIQEANQRGQPVLVGTVTVEQSEVLSRMLKRAGVIHTVLNAKFHQQEAEIVSRAGQRGSVTIATNMAGRGTDIKLGEGVRELGGLFVVGTERHESRRIDRQLRGRCSRQGDPGQTKFFLSLEDDLMRLFLQGNLASKIMEGSMKEGEELEHKWLNYSIESAQKKVEQQNFAIRKRLLQYDDVLNKQREVIYGIRNGALHSERPKDIIFEMIEEEIANRLETANYNGKGAASSDLEALVGWLNSHFPISAKVEELKGDAESLLKAIVERIRGAYALKESVEDQQALGGLERYIVINAIDHHWQEHLTEMEELRRSIGLRSYGQKDPLSEYKGEAFRFFEELMNNVRLQICTSLFRSATNRDAFENLFAILSRSARMQGPAAAPTALSAAAQATAPAGEAPSAASAPAEQEIKLPAVTIRRETPKVGRNDPCPCGSGKKFKNCHGV
ncbi:preprotein translocase subunit SecA [Oleiharenicola lentus]|uniref:Protein translocase subunit SecA n=1 Tax=Oleiharenicola lentus TaxID=2508720 RepID=A0A4Q1C4G7_9BACT|nr:preprotein translocase subunit SecA [Oleiharenicola lentus]RXK53159.1 preprotein translocase subunit SecA [Oleiharenicola lentus]